MTWCSGQRPDFAGAAATVGLHQGGRGPEPFAAVELSDIIAAKDNLASLNHVEVLVCGLRKLIRSAKVIRGICRPLAHACGIATGAEPARGCGLRGGGARHRPWLCWLTAPRAAMPSKNGGRMGRGQNRAARAASQTPKWFASKPPKLASRARSRAMWRLALGHVHEGCSLFPRRAFPSGMSFACRADWAETVTPEDRRCPRRVVPHLPRRQQRHGDHPAPERRSQPAGSDLFDRRMCPSFWKVLIPRGRRWRRRLPAR